MTVVLATDTHLLLRAIREQPDEDTPRLMLADEMQANGFDGAAEYVRTSIENHQQLRRPTAVAIANDYVRWIRSLVSGFPTIYCSEFLGRDLRGFTWRAGQRHWCEFIVEGGLPTFLRTTAPMLMSHRAEQFLFPLQTVTVTDRKPSRDFLPYSNGWAWIGMPYPQRWNTWEDVPHEIPRPLWEHLTPFPTMNRGRYRTRADAMTDLRSAALAFGRAAVA